MDQEYQTIITLRAGMADNPELLSQFTAITGADEERAKFYLESSAWKLDIAISRYYENDGLDPGEEGIAVQQPSDTDQSHQATPPRPKSKTTNSNFATLNTLTTSSDEEEEEGQAFYAGGSEHSGQQVLGPSKKKDFVSGMFKSVQKHVEIVDQKPGGSKVFKGTGYKLGQTADDSVEVAGAAGPASSPEVTLKLWKDGFTVNDGELRAYTDPANTEFLQSIQQGEIPQELRQGSSEVYLAMEDHRMETYKQSVDRGLKPFTGHGYTLGSPTPPVVGATREEDKPANEARAKQESNVDTSQPTTNIQIRLSDGSRLVAQFNHSHTVGQVRQYILTARPQYQTRSFNLLSGYPSRILDDSQTLSEGNLLNSAIMQKLI